MCSQTRWDLCTDCFFTTYLKLPATGSVTEYLPEKLIWKIRRFTNDSFFLSSPEYFMGFLFLWKNFIVKNLVADVIFYKSHLPLFNSLPDSSTLLQKHMRSELSQMHFLPLPELSLEVHHFLQAQVVFHLMSSHENGIYPALPAQKLLQFLEVLPL